MILRNNQFCIQYFPSTAEPKAECNAVLERLYGCLELITVVENETTNSLTRGSRMKGEVIDGVLNRAKHNYLYFCAKATLDGTHAFSETLAQHNRYAKAYQAALNRLKIR